MKNFLVVEVSHLSFKIIYNKDKKQPIKHINISNYDSPTTEKTFINNIKTFIHTNNITTKNIALIIKESDSIKRFINLPNIRNSNLESMINNNLSDFIPVDTSNYSTDYKILSKDNENIDIMLIAMLKTITYYYLDIFRKLNLNCFCIDTFYNCVSDYFSKYKEKILIGYISGDKYFIIYMEDAIIKNIRDFEFFD